MTVIRGIRVPRRPQAGEPRDEEGFCRGRALKGVSASCLHYKPLKCISGDDHQFLPHPGLKIDRP